MTENSPAAETTSPPFLDEGEGSLFPGVRWLTPRRLAFFLIFWATIFFAGSIFVNNPFAGSALASNWNVGSGSPNYYWVVMYLHGLNTGLVGIAALVACDFFELPSIHVRRGILAGVLIAGVLSPIGAVFNTSAPWTNAGLWIQITAFLALDEIVILFLWGMLTVWREGAPRSRTFPFITASLTGGVMLVAALMGHLAGIILGFGDNPALLGQYAAQEMGLSLDAWAASLIGAHSYLMITAVPAGLMALAAVRFGYYRLAGRRSCWPRWGSPWCASISCSRRGWGSSSDSRAGRATFPPRSVPCPGVPSFLALNDASNFVFLVLGGILLLSALVIGTGRVKGWTSPAGLPIRVLPLLMLVVFTVLTAVSEPTNGTAIGTPPQAWVRLFIGFYLTMMVVLVVLLAERMLGERQSLRIGWTATVGAVTHLRRRVGLRVEWPLRRRVHRGRRSHHHWALVRAYFVVGPFRRIPKPARRVDSRAAAGAAQEGRRENRTSQKSPLAARGQRGLAPGPNEPGGFQCDTCALRGRSCYVRFRSTRNRRSRLRELSADRTMATFSPEARVFVHATCYRRRSRTWTAAATNS